MSDPFATQSNQKVIREAQASLSLIAILLIVFVYVTYYRMTGQGSRVPDHVLRAPVSQSVLSQGDDGQLPSHFQTQSSSPREFPSLAGRSPRDSSVDRRGDGNRNDRTFSNRGQQNPIDAAGPNFSSSPPNAASQSPSEMIADNAASLNQKITDSLAAMDKIQASLKRSLEEDHAVAETPIKQPIQASMESPAQEPRNLLAKINQPLGKEAAPTDSAPTFSQLEADKLGAKRLIKSAQPLKSTFVTREEHNSGDSKFGQVKSRQNTQRQNTRIKVVDDRGSALTGQVSTFSNPEPKLNAPRPIVPNRDDVSLSTSRPLHFNGLRATGNSPNLTGGNSPTGQFELAATTVINKKRNTGDSASPQTNLDSGPNSQSKRMTIQVTGAESVSPANPDDPNRPTLSREITPVENSNSFSNSFSGAPVGVAPASNDFVGNVPPSGTATNLLNANDRLKKNRVDSVQTNGARESTSILEPRTNNHVESFYQLPAALNGSAPANVSAVADSAPKIDWLTAPHQVEPVNSGSAEHNNYAAVSDDASSTPQLLNDSRKHVVQHGDSFWTIAQSRYGDGRYFRALYKYNELTVDSFDHLEAGTPIDTPDREDLSKLYPSLCPPPEPTLRSPDITNANDLRSNQDSSDLRFENRPTRFELRATQYYVTREGDTLFEIARQRLGQASRFAEIYDANSEQLHHDVGHLTQLGAGIKLKLPPLDR